MIVNLETVRPDPNMGFSLDTALSAPFTAIGMVTKPIFAGAGNILTQATSAISPALQALRPPPAGVAPPPASNLPLYLGGAAALLVLVVLLTRPRSSAPSAT